MNDRIQAIKGLLLGTDTATEEELKDAFEVSSYDDCIIECEDGREWLVLTEEERGERWEEALESYLEGCIYPELPENMVNYFDSEKWKQDARYDGCGHCLASYDGEEHAHGAYYIYRTN